MTGSCNRVGTLSEAILFVPEKASTYIFMDSEGMDRFVGLSGI